MSKGLSALSQAGVSVWLDDLSRDLIKGGGLAAHVANGVKGVTTNPSIFDAALRNGSTYDVILDEVKKSGGSVDEAIRAFTISDVQAACDVFASVYDKTHGLDGRVSLEVDPRLARDTEGTIAQAKELSAAVDRAGLMVKIPATLEGLPAITATIAAGISVNVTLIFGRARYAEVVDAFLEGLEQADESGLDISQIHSVASFFVSRVDTAIDPILDAAGGDSAALRGKAGVANAVLAYRAHLESLESPRWLELAGSGANAQRPLWASTGVKDPAYPDTLYVDSLVASGTVNTMPPTTLAAADDHANVSHPITERFEQADHDLALLAKAGVDLDEITSALEGEGVKKFVDSWESLRSAVAERLNS